LLYFASHFAEQARTNGIEHFRGKGIVLRSNGGIVGVDARFAAVVHFRGVYARLDGNDGMTGF
jgi:hypothetical protein